MAQRVTVRHASETMRTLRTSPAPPRRSARSFVFSASLLAIVSAPAAAGSTAPELENPATRSADRKADEAWWTGPLLTSTADTLPRGGIYFEPYLFSVISPGNHSIGSTAFIQYGLLEDFTVGVLPSLWNVRHGEGRRTLPGDLTLLAQLRIARFDRSRSVPSISLVVRQAIPTGKHDRLSVGSEGSGAGAYSTSVGTNVQYYWWLKNGRPLRGRLNLLFTLPSQASVRERSVYGTEHGFRGYARRGLVTTFGTSVEYSVSRSVALALDLVHQRGGRTTVVDLTQNAGAGRRVIASQQSWSIAPAIEYSWSAREGVLVGIRYVPAAAPAPRSITPVIAFSRGW